MPYQTRQDGKTNQDKDVPCQWRGISSGRNLYEQKKSVCSTIHSGGYFVFAIPIVYHYTGMRETEKLTQEFEQNLEEVQEDETEMEETGEEKNEATGRSEDAAIFAEGDVIAILEIEALDIRYPVV